MGTWLAHTLENVSAIQAVLIVGAISAIVATDVAVAIILTIGAICQIVIVIVEENSVVSSFVSCAVLLACHHYGSSECAHVSTHEVACYRTREGTDGLRRPPF